MSNIQFNFSGKRALVTGGGQGIGRQIAKDFLAAGAEVIIWELFPAKLKSLKKEFPSKLVVKKADVSSRKSCAQASASLKKPIDFLINNAGILRDRSLAKMSWEEYSSVIEINLNGVFLTTKALLPHFKSQSKNKRIINISSIVALNGNFGQSNYSAAKAGVLGLTKVWSKELGRKGWTVNAIAPGFIQTDILKNMPQEGLNRLVASIPAGHIGQPQGCLQNLLVSLLRGGFLHQRFRFGSHRRILKCFGLLFPTLKRMLMWRFSLSV